MAGQIAGVNLKKDSGADIPVGGPGHPLFVGSITLHFGSKRPGKGGLYPDTCLLSGARRLYHFDPPFAAVLFPWALSWILSEA